MIRLDQMPPRHCSFSTFGNRPLRSALRPSLPSALLLCTETEDTDIYKVPRRSRDSVLGRSRKLYTHINLFSP